jgi:hypothetical protein
MTIDDLDLDALEEGVRRFEEYDRKRADGNEINTIAALSPAALLSLIARVRDAEQDYAREVEIHKRTIEIAGTLITERNALREALAKYGRHDDDCASLQPWSGGARGTGADLCDSGLNDAKEKQ